MADDRTEMNNPVDQHPQRAGQMQQEFMAWADEIEAPLTGIDPP